MKKKMIIFCGADGSGKTTLAGEISRLTGFPVEHHGPVHTYLEGKMQYFHDVYKNDYSVIKDRFYEGEVIFAPLYRGYEADYIEELEDLIIEKFDPLLIYVHAPFDVLVKRCKERGEDFIKNDADMFYFYELTNKFFNMSKLPKIMINSDDFTLENNVEKIRKHLFTNMY